MYLLEDDCKQRYLVAFSLKWVDDQNWSQKKQAAGTRLWDWS